MARPQLVSDEAVLTAARLVFLSNGARASMDAVAEQVGISAPALFKRYGSKKDLMVAALTPPPPKWFWRLLAGPTAAPIEDQLRELATEMDTFFAEMVPCMMVLKEAGIAEKAMIAFASSRAKLGGIDVPDAMPFPILARNTLAEYLAQVADAGLLVVVNPTVAAQMFLGGIQSRHFMLHINGGEKDQDTAGFVNAYVDILIHGLEANPSNEEEA